MASACSICKGEGARYWGNGGSLVRGEVRTEKSTQRLKCNGTRAGTRFLLSAKRTCPFKSAWASVQSTTSSRDVRISSSNTGYTMFRGSVKRTGYPLHSPVSPSLPLPYVSVYHHISTGLYIAVKFIVWDVSLRRYLLISSVRIEEKSFCLSECCGYQLLQNGGDNFLSDLWTGEEWVGFIGLLFALANITKLVTQPITHSHSVHARPARQ